MEEFALRPKTEGGRVIIATTTTTVKLHAVAPTTNKAGVFAKIMKESPKPKD